MCFVGLTVLTVLKVTCQQPRPGGSDGWSAIAFTERLLWVRFPVRAHAWPEGLILHWDMDGRQLVNVSLSAPKNINEHILESGLKKVTSQQHKLQYLIKKNLVFQLSLKRKGRKPGNSGLFVPVRQNQQAE